MEKKVNLQTDAREKKNKKTKKQHEVSDCDTTEGSDSNKETDTRSDSNKEGKPMADERGPIRMRKNDRSAQA